MGFAWVAVTRNTRDALSALPLSLLERKHYPNLLAFSNSETIRPSVIQSLLKARSVPARQSAEGSYGPVSAFGVAARGITGRASGSRIEAYRALQRPGCGARGLAGSLACLTALSGAELRTVVLVVKVALDPIRAIGM